MEREIQASAEALSNAKTTKEMAAIRRLLDTLESHKEEVNRQTSMISKYQAEKLIMENELRELANTGAELVGVTDQCALQGSQPVNYEQTRKKELFFMCFGLQFVLDEGKAMKLVFTSLDPREPAKEHFVVMDLDSSNQWLLLDVQPKVEGVGELISDLNRTQNFSEFCKSVRAQFKHNVYSLADS